MVRNLIRREPDFSRLLAALRCEEPDHVPIGELIIEGRAMEAVMERPVVTQADVVEFFAVAGYDFARVTPVIRLLPSERLPEEEKRLSELDHTRLFSPEGRGVISSWEDFEKYPWPTPEETDYSPLEEAARALPEGMKIVGHHGDIFTRCWEYFGFENFCVTLYEDIALVRAVMDRIGEVVFDAFKRMAEMPEVGALWYSDDIAYASGLLISAKHLRELLFPWMERIGELCRARNLPFIYHTDGVLWEVLDDLAALGVNAIHPVEPKAMDIREVKQRYRGKLCVWGNVEVDLLARGTPEEVREQVRWLIKNVAPGGGYVLGSSNTIPDYVNPECYIAMIEEAKRLG